MSTTVLASTLTITAVPPGSTITPAAQSFVATLKYGSTSCTATPALIAYQFAKQCQQTVNGSTLSVCSSDASYAQQTDCVADFSSYAKAKFGSTPYAELIIYQGSDCNKMSNIVGVRQYDLNKKFEWEINQGLIYSGIAAYNPVNPSRLLLGECKDSSCKTVVAGMAEMFPTDSSACYNPALLFNPGTYVKTTLYNVGNGIVPPANGFPNMSSSYHGKSIQLAIVAALTFVFF
ncbi:hypothetical protein BC830DRAFT_1131480 [Chytriomyces sp. MP71]|nr:hypothetical protein BC830DRAFT_1131480 [Chytriomyces sp. MP71]